MSKRSLTWRWREVPERIEPMTESTTGAMSEPSTGVMSGVRVVEVASHVFVPGAGAILAEWGAEVVKIEHPRTGDPYRGLRTQGLHATHRGVDVNFQHANRAKRSVGLDLTTTDGRALLDRFLAVSDVFLTSLRPRARVKLGLDVDDVKAANDSIIYARGSGQGPTGPHADRAGYDVAAYWARSGLTALMQGDAPSPTFPPPGFGDLAGSLALAASTAGALYRRATTGEGSVVDVSLLGVGMWQLNPDIIDATLRSRVEPKVRDRYATWNPLVEVYRTRDGRSIQFVVVDADNYWSDLCRIIGAPELAADPRFADLDRRREHCRECVEALDAVFARRDLDEWLTVLDAFDGAWTPIQLPGEVVRDPQVVANGYVGDADLEGGDTIPMVVAPFQFDGVPTVPRRAPEHGEHTELALLDLGVDWDEIVDLKDRGVIP
jgi:crotonobetainyl-CoA:carnitine CoA-transferase CaiB-like acyl-CoA transferase